MLITVWRHHPLLFLPFYCLCLPAHGNPCSDQDKGGRLWPTCPNQIALSSHLHRNAFMMRTDVLVHQKGCTSPVYNELEQNIYFLKQQPYGYSASLR